MAADGRAIRFRVLGPLVIDTVDHPPRALKQRMLLAALLATPGRAVGRSALTDLLWDGDAPSEARSALQVIVARLRRELTTAGVVIETTEDGYRISVDPDEVDHVRVRTIADRSDPSRCELDEALALWRGPPFGDLGDAPLLRAVADELVLAHERLVARLHQVRLDDGEVSAVLPALARWAEDRPLDESAWCRWAGALASTGRIAEALRALHELRASLAAVGLEPSAMVAGLEHRLLAGPMGGTVAGRPLASTEMLGRDVELTELVRLTAAHRLVTLVGVGGVGKTRLAVAMTQREMVAAFGEVQWSDLATLTDATSVVPAVSAACGVQQQAGLSTAESLPAAVGARRLLLVLDNCEHVVDEVRHVVSTLLRECPNMRVLATSRQPLDLTGEIVFRLGPLPVTEEDGTPGPAARLFALRASDRGCVVPTDQATTDAVIDVCRRLDGLPLAVELAAARSTLLSPAEIARHLDRSFELLRLPHAPLGGLPRHQTLVGAIAWSYDLLDDPERDLLDRLSVFAGSFDLAAVEHVCAIDATLETLQALVDRSLVVVGDSPAGTRYRLLDTIRRFAAERLAARGETEQRRALRNQWYELVAAASGVGSRTRDLTTWQRRVDADLANFRATFDDLVGAGDVDGCQALVAGLWPTMLGDTSLVHTDWAPASVDLAPEHIGPATAAARAAAAWSAVTAGDYARADALGAQALDAVAAGSDDDGAAANVVAVQSMFTRAGRQHAAGVAADEVQRARSAGDQERLVRALVHRYFTRTSRENDERRCDAVEAVDLARRLGHPRHLGTALCHLAWQRHRDGDGRAGPLAAEAATWSELCRDVVMYSYAMHLLGSITQEQGRPDEGLGHVVNALRCWRRCGDVRAWVALHQIAELLADAGDAETATILFAGIGRRDLGAQVRLHPEALTAAVATIEPLRREQLFTDGAGRDLDELIDMATQAIERIARP